jgi:hypothetical protein
VGETYFVRFRGRTVGPYSLAQAQQMARKGQLSRTSEVSDDGQEWSQAGSFPEIFARPAGGPFAAGKSSSLSIDADLSPDGSITFPAFDVPKTPSLNEWYYTFGDEQKGPTSSTNIVAMIKAGTLAAQDRVWREGLDNWVSVSDVPEFSAASGPVFPQATASRGAGTDGGAFCRECGARINRKAVICTQCGVPQHSDGGEFSFPAGGSASRAAKQAQGNGLIVAGYVCAAVALLFLPPVFALAAFIIGIINLTRNQIGHGIAQIVLSVICGFFGMVIGAALMS